jgi:lysozyme
VLLFFGGCLKLRDYRMNQNLLDQLKKHEGFRGQVYKCTAGANTIGYGRNLDANPLTPDEAEHLLKNDVAFMVEKLRDKHLLAGHNEARQAVIVNMAFNIGFAGLMKFKNMLTHYMEHEYHLAAEEMLDSKWARQVGNRAIELSEQMASGEWQ